MKAKIALGVELNQPVVRVVRGHKGKMLTTEITENTEDTKNRWLALFIIHDCLEALSYAVA
jgi:hypothetical protein